VLNTDSVRNRGFLYKQLFFCHFAAILPSVSNLIQTFCENEM
jgi:hypothetical protein